MLCQPDTYVPQNWHVTLLYWAIIGFCVFINIAAGWLLPKFEGALLVLHILGFFAILIPLLVLGPQGNAKEIFTTFINLGGWQTQGLSFCIGIMGSVFAFVGGDGPIHVSVPTDDQDRPCQIPDRKPLTYCYSYLRKSITHRSLYLAPS
jgi:amino acid transporter